MRSKMNQYRPNSEHLFRWLEALRNSEVLSFQTSYWAWKRTPQDSHEVELNHQPQKKLEDNDNPNLEDNGQHC